MAEKEVKRSMRMKRRRWRRWEERRREGVEDHDLPIQNRAARVSYTTVIKPINPRHNQPLTQILYLFIFSGLSGSALGSAPPIPLDESFVSHSSNHFLIIIASPKYRLFLLR